MTEKPRGQEARVRPWIIDAVAGGGLALAIITVANAALPHRDRTPARPAPADVRPASAAPAQPRALIAFQTPAPGFPVISPFGLRKLPWEGSGRLHAGVDIAAPRGEPVLAAADGVVTRLAVDPGYGLFVEVRHPAGLVTRYGHLSAYRPEVRPGLAVRAGQALGSMGSTGSSTGSHLHFEIRDARDRPLNPEMFLGRSFAQAADLPLEAAARFPRGVRLAYVSNIPRSKREEMEARLQLASAPAPKPEAIKAQPTPGADSAFEARGAAALDSGDMGWPGGADARPHARFSFGPTG